MPRVDAGAGRRCGRRSSTAPAPRAATAPMPEANASAASAPSSSATASSNALHRRVAVAAVEARRPGPTVAMRRCSSSAVDLVRRSTAHSTGAERTSGVGRRPARDGDGVRRGPAASAGARRASVIGRLLHLVEERRRPARPTWSSSMQEGVVAVRAVDLDVARPACRWRASSSADLPLLVGRVEDVAADADRQRRAPGCGPSPRSRPPRPRPTSCRSIALVEQQVAVGVEAPDQLVAVVLEVALDLEALPQREAASSGSTTSRPKRSVNTSSLRKVIWATMRAMARPSWGPSPGSAS